MFNQQEKEKLQELQKQTNAKLMNTVDEYFSQIEQELREKATAKGLSPEEVETMLKEIKQKAKAKIMERFQANLKEKLSEKPKPG